MSALRKKVSQQELRLLMNRHRDKARNDPAKRVDSPLAKYATDGTLTCILCNAVVKSEAVWNVHINCKLHRNNVQLAKQKGLSGNSESPRLRTEVSIKRLNEDYTDSPIPTKKIKGILKNAPPKPSNSTVPSDFFDSGKASPKTPVHQEITSELPQDKMDDQNECKDESEVSKEEQPGSSSENINDTLPEGFFDDPKMDAKARNVEYKDPIEEEWERFQKEIKEEVTFSTQIIEDDHEEATAERQIEEIDEQLRNWNRVLELERKKEAVKAAERIKMEVDDDLSSGEEDFDEFLDWRSKKSYS